MTEEGLTIRQVLILARGSCNEPPCYFGAYCPRYWRRVFELYYQLAPTGDNDKRWDELFALGFPERRAMLEEETQIQAAS